MPDCSPFMNLFLCIYVLFAFILPLIRYAAFLLRSYFRLKQYKINFWILDSENALHPEALLYKKQLSSELRRIAIYWFAGIILLPVILFLFSLFR